MREHRSGGYHEDGERKKRNLRAEESTVILTAVLEGESAIGKKPLI